VAELTIHHGRHSFVSHALRHRTLAEVRDAAGHSNIATTSIYAHVATDDDGEIANIFAIADPPASRPSTGARRG
jgi:site-specific recombinase XerC